MIEITEAKIGRSMKNRVNTIDGLAWDGRSKFGQWVDAAVSAAVLEAGAAAPAATAAPGAAAADLGGFAAATVFFPADPSRSRSNSRADTGTSLRSFCKPETTTRSSAATPWLTSR